MWNLSLIHISEGLALLVEVEISLYQLSVCISGLILGGDFDGAGDNVIGAEELASNYAVLDTLYTDTVKGVDTAFGDLYFFDGESKTDATINEVVGCLLYTSRCV